MRNCGFSEVRYRQQYKTTILYCSPNPNLHGKIHFLMCCNVMSVVDAVYKHIPIHTQISKDAVSTAMTPTDSKVSKDLHRTHCFYATKCVYVCWCGYTWENWGSCESNYSKNKLKTWWNKQQTSWLQAIAHTVWLITFNDKLFDQCHVYEWTDWWFLVINKPGCLEKRSRGELWGSVET